MQVFSINQANEGKPIAGYEVEPVKEFKDPDNPANNYCTRVETDEDAEFFSVYVRYKEGIADCIADCETRKEAQMFTDLLTMLERGNKYFPQNTQE